jgi:hypothetical protein
MIDLSGDITCPESHPIKGQTSNAVTGVTTFQCYTQFYWDAYLMGGQAFMDFAAAIAAGRGFDADVIAAVSQAVTNYKAERIAIDALRDDAQRRAQEEADASPGDVICKSWSYTSVYNGSGGGSVCAVNNNPVDVSVKPSAPAGLQISQAPAMPASPSTSSATGVKSGPVLSQTFGVKTLATAKYFTKVAKASKQKGTQPKFTIPKAPKGSKLSVFKSSASDCNLKGRTVKASPFGTCELTLTITKQGVLMGMQKLTVPSTSSATGVKSGPVLSQTFGVKTVATANYFTKVAKASKQKGTQPKFTIPNAPKGSKLSVFKSSASDCNLKVRTVKASPSGTCELTLTITKQGVLMGMQKLTVNRG